MKSSRMIPRALGRAAVFALATAQFAGPVMAQRLSRNIPADSFQQNYSALSEHNIFKKDRAPQTPIHGNVSVRPSPERSFVVTGIVCDDQGQYALVEDVMNGTVRRLAEGDRLAGGTVIDIAIEGMTFTPAGQGSSILVPAGADLTGTIVDSVAGERRRSAMRPAPTRPSVENVNPGNLSGGQERN